MSIHRIGKTRNKRLLTVLAATLIIMVMGAGVLYSKRQDLRDFYWRQRQGPVPPALTINDIRERQAANTPAIEPQPPMPEPAAPAATEPEMPVSDAGAPPSLPDAEEPVPEPPTPPTGADDSLPAAINLAVPMVYQAPLSNWDPTHEDACEEASILMIKAFLDGEKSFSREEMDRRILAVVDYEMKAFGYFESTDAATTAAIMRDHLGLSGIRIIPVTSIDDVKRQLAAGRPVLIPADGKALNNPNFRHGGPPYHMLVAKGYKPGKIITNDPGTRLGADYIYDEKVLFDAIHDLNGGDTPNGEKVIIVVE